MCYHLFITLSYISLGLTVLLLDLSVSCRYCIREQVSPFATLLVEEVSVIYRRSPRVTLPRASPPNHTEFKSHTGSPNYHNALLLHITTTVASQSRAATILLFDSGP